MSETSEKIDLLLSYLSEIHTNSLSLYDLATSHPRHKEAYLLLNINEVNTYYHSARVFYYSNHELTMTGVKAFFDAFEDFYFELKQVLLNEDDNNLLLYNKLSVMKDSFERLTNEFNVL